MRFKLSKTANSVVKCISNQYFASQEIKRISQLIGQYTGTDIYHKPGDIYVQKAVRKRNYIYILGRDRLARWPYSIEFKIEQYILYKVRSRTPCTIKCEHMVNVFVFTNNPRSGYIRQLYPSEFVDQQYRFVMKQFPEHPVYLQTFRPDLYWSAQVEQEFNNMNLDIINLPTIKDNHNIRFDVNNRDLVCAPRLFQANPFRFSL